MRFNQTNPDPNTKGSLRNSAIAEDPEEVRKKIIKITSSKFQLS
jgi:hypothetical protein